MWQTSLNLGRLYKSEAYSRFTFLDFRLSKIVQNSRTFKIIQDYKLQSRNKCNSDNLEFIRKLLLSQKTWIFVNYDFYQILENLYLIIIYVPNKADKRSKVAGLFGRTVIEPVWKIVSLGTSENINTKKANVYPLPKTVSLANGGTRTILITLAVMHHLHQNYAQIISVLIMMENPLGAIPPIPSNDMIFVTSREYNKTSIVNDQ